MSPLSCLQAGVVVVCDVWEKNLKFADAQWTNVTLNVRFLFSHQTCQLAEPKTLLFLVVGLQLMCVS